MTSLQNLSVAKMIEHYQTYRKRENYTKGDSGNTKVAGLALGLFLLLFVVVIGLWIWAIVVLIRYWKVMPTWAKVIGFLGIIPVFPFGSVVTLVVVYATKE